MATCETCGIKLSASDTTPCGFDECLIEREGFEICPYCGGEGSDEVSKPQHDDPYFAVSVTCTECNGSGYVWADPDKYDPMAGVEFPFADNH